jgi:hypothetical protein
MSAFPNDTELFSRDFFEALRRRLVPLVGNLPERVRSDRFDPDYAWIEVVRELYPKASFIAAREYQRLGTATQHWLLRLSSTGELRSVWRSSRSEQLGMRWV